MAISSQESADSQLLLPGLGFEPPFSQKSIPIAASCSENDGQVSQTSEISEQQTFWHGAEESMFSQPASPASQQALPGSEEARRMTVGSGTQCSMWLEQSSRLGAFSKILLGSSHWTNSEEYCYVWSRLDTKFGFSAFQLTALELSTDGNESLLLGTPDASHAAGPNGQQSSLKNTLNRLWRTPNTFDNLEPKSQEALDHEVEATHSGREPNNLRDQAAVRSGMRLWRTPGASDNERGHQNGFERRAAGHQINLGEQAATPALWPTPRKEGYDSQGKGHGDLVYEVKNRLWPTARATDWKAGNNKTNRSDPAQSDKAGWNLLEAARLWPTPWSADGERNYSVSPNSARKGGNLTEELSRMLWPTPQAHDAAKGDPKRVGRHGTKHGCRNLNDTAASLLPTPRHDHSGLESHGVTHLGGSLNPRFVEELMGYPIDHTALSPSAMRSFRLKRSPSSKRSPKLS